MKTAAIYARYSTDLQNARSIDDQFHVCKERARREGWSISECYSDYAISGASMERPGLQQMLHDARAGGFEIILTEALDRLSRDQADMATIYKQMQFGSIEIFTLSEGCVGILDVGLRGTMNQLYRVETANKVRRGLLGRIKEGKIATGNSYGYDVVKRFDSAGEPVRGERKINRQQAHIVRRIFQQYADGLTRSAIAEALNKEGVPSPWGKTWSHTSIGGGRIQGVLNNEIYVGVFAWNRRTSISDPYTGKVLVRFNPERDIVRQQIPTMRIVEQRIWDKVKARQEKMRRPRVENPILGKRRLKSMFWDLLKCGQCGGPITTPKPDRLGCAASRSKTACTNRLRIGLQDFENKVFNALKERLSVDTELCVAFCEAYARRLKEVRTKTSKAIQSLRDELRRIEAEYDSLSDAPKGVNSTPALEAEMEGIMARHKTLTRQLAQGLKAVEPWEKRYREQVHGLVDGLSKNRRHQAGYDSLKALVGGVVLRPNDDGTALLVEVDGHQRPGRWNVHIGAPQSVAPV